MSQTKLTLFFFPYRSVYPLLFSRLLMGSLTLHPSLPGTITVYTCCPGTIITSGPFTFKIVLVWIAYHRMVTTTTCLKRSALKNHHVSPFVKGLWSNIDVHVSYSSSFYSEWLSTVHFPVHFQHTRYYYLHLCRKFSILLSLHVQIWNPDILTVGSPDRCLTLQVSVCPLPSDLTHFDL